jgi:maltose alpha-D-glucosyltransferase/alpha-amylase
VEEFLANRGFPHIPGVVGSVSYYRRNGERFSVGMMTRFMKGAKSGWLFTQDALGRFFDRVTTMSLEAQDPRVFSDSVLAIASAEPGKETIAAMGTFMENARLLGQRTGELHLALASDADNREFVPEPFTPFYQRSLFQSMRNQAVQALQLLRRNLNRIEARFRPEAEFLVQHEGDILRTLKTVYERRIAARRIRCHGDLHLVETLHTGKDFVFLHLGGEASRPLGERRIKRPVLRDVASMLRSFDYAVSTFLLAQIDTGAVDEARLPQVRAWGAFWLKSAGGAFLRGYLEVMKDSVLLPRSADDIRVLLTAHQLEKAMLEMCYELRTRPAWMEVPIKAVIELLRGQKGKEDAKTKEGMG